MEPPDVQAAGAAPQALYYITVNINNKKLTILCDTGAAVSLISVKEANRLHLIVEPLGSNDTKILFTADGKPMRPLGKVTAEISIGGCNFDYNFDVLPPVHTNAIFGLDFLVFAQCRMNSV